MMKRGEKLTTHTHTQREREGYCLTKYATRNEKTSI